MARKLALLIVSVAAALAMGFWLAPKLRAKLHPDPNVIRLLPGETADQSELERAEMLERLKWLEEQYPSIPIQAFDDTTLIRAQIQRPIMDRLYASVRIGDMAYHPVLNFRRRPNQNERYNWPEHPRGFWRVQTNSEGLRMNAERGPGPYLVIAGDSHMEGAASNEESAAGLMQAALDSERPDLQVVNMACGGYSFPQYLAAVEYLCQDRPGERVDPKRPIPIEALVVVVYGGNDFTEGLRLAHHWNQTFRPKGWGQYTPKLDPWRATHSHAIAQGVDSLLYFRQSPSERDVALQNGLDTLEELQRHATRRGFRLLVAYLPAVFEVELAPHAESLDPMLNDLEIGTADFEAAGALADRFLTQTKALGIETLDLRPTLQAGGPYYWDSDLHLNLDGQERVAARLLDWFRTAQPNAK